MSDARFVMTPEHFAGLGSGQIAFVKSVRSEQIRDLFPDAPQLDPGQTFWALIDAAGAPLMVSDSRDAVVLNAREHSLEAMSLH